MADIAMCLNAFCKDNMKCHRYTAVMNEHWQSIVHITGEQSKETCDMFWDNEGYRKDPKRFLEGGEK